MPKHHLLLLDLEESYHQKWGAKCECGVASPLEMVLLCGMTQEFLWKH